MQRYTFVNESAPKPKGSLMRSMRAHITEYTVKNHVSLLIGQAVVLVLLALIHIGFQYQAVNQEKGAIASWKNLRFGQHIVAESKQITRNSQPVVLGTEDTSETTTVPEPTSTLPRQMYTIALIGDSMVDTMGEQGDFLRDALARKYPGVQFVIYNYGKGARNVTQGLEDFHEPFKYKDRNFMSIDRVKPDVIVVGSFAYNPFDPHDRNLHWLQYTRLVQEAQKITPHVYMLAEIAPIRSGFGIGANGIVWEPSTAYAHTAKIIEQLKNVLGLSDALHVPVIDAYTPSLVDGREEGKRELVNTSDNIHPSTQGHEMMAELMVEKIDFEEIK